MKHQVWSPSDITERRKEKKKREKKKKIPYTTFLLFLFFYRGPAVGNEPYGYSSLLTMTFVCHSITGSFAHPTNAYCFNLLSHCKLSDYDRKLWHLKDNLVLDTSYHPSPSSPYQLVISALLSGSWHKAQSIPSKIAIYLPNQSWIRY